MHEFDSKNIPKSIRGRTNFVTKTLCILTNVKIYRNVILSNS